LTTSFSYSRTLRSDAKAFFFFLLFSACLFSCQAAGYGQDSVIDLTHVILISQNSILSAAIGNFIGIVFDAGTILFASISPGELIGVSSEWNRQGEYPGLGLLRTE